MSDRFKGGKINEILESGTFPNTHVFRVPQDWSSWKNGKATGRQMQSRRHKPEQQAFSIATKQGKDEKAPVMNKNFT